MKTIANLGWHEDLGEALSDARRTGRAVLSLQMLGRLDEEFSCANSRFFRATLYPSAPVARVLSERFVLHWRSVRRVPRVTVDFGDGRRFEQTLTGNSAHLVLDARGRTVDVLPGLYDAGSFARLASASADLAQSTFGLDGVERHTRLTRWHAARYAAVVRAWRSDLRRLGRDVPEDFVALERATDDESWVRLGSLYAGEALPDPRLNAVLAASMPNARDAGRLAMSKAAVERPLLDALLPLARTIAQDAVRNEYSLHGRAHHCFATGRAPEGPNALCNWTYAELFKMPLDDPWLGLRAAAFAAYGWAGSGHALS